jgi:glycosyltransferase involved in cell wall biosynthesis
VTDLNTPNIFFVFLKNYDLKLICAGGGDFTLNELSIIKSLNLQSHVVFKKITNDVVLSNYYANALCFCFPSLYEGFGIPILEAFACGCPVLSSNSGSLPEIGGDAALYFDSNNINSLILAMKKILNDGLLRKTLIDKAYARLQHFSWDKTYQAHLNIYKSIK